LGTEIDPRHRPSSALLTAGLAFQNLKKQNPFMKSNCSKTALVSLIALTVTLASLAQTVTTPVPNRVISWNLDDWSTINPTDLAGLAPATNWVDTYLNNVTMSLPDNTGAATTMNLGYGSFNTYHVQANHVGLDANGTANREMLNGYLNSGPASWNPPTTNTYISMTNIPYSQYDVIVYFNSDTSGRHARISNGSVSYYFSTMGNAVRSGPNALFLPTTATSGSTFPSADFAFFPGLTSPNAIFTTYPLSGNDQWLGIAAFQVVQSSNVYVLYGPSPATQLVPLGQSASFSVMAGGLNPSYQWRHNGTNLPSATSASFSIASTAPGQDGNYDVVVSNSFSSVTSVVATLTFYTPKTLQWAGMGSVWDTSSLNWTVNGGASTTNYTETDNARLDPLGAAQPNISLGSSLTPSSIVVSNSTYTLTSGGLMGNGSLRLVNNAYLVLDTADTRTGPTTIDHGSTLQLDNNDTAGSLGAGSLTNNGALQFNSSGDEAYGYPIYGTGNVTNASSAGTITLGNTVNANYLVQSGNGILLLQGNNSLSGGLVVNAGTVWARSGGALGAASVVLNGGELQLIYGFDFVGSSLALAGGVLHGGVGGSQIFEGPVSVSADSSISIDGGNSLTLNNISGIAGNGFNLFLLGGGGRLILSGANNTWGSFTINAGTLQIGNGGVGSLGGGTITDVGTLAFDSSSAIVATNPITGAGSIVQNGTGIVTLTADNNAAGFQGELDVTNGTMLVNGTSGPGNVNVAGGTFGGTGTIGGTVTVLPGATLAPGSSSVGTLTLSSSLALSGNVLVQANKSLSPSNSMVAVSGALINTGSGTVTVNNLGPALKVGDSFQLFNQPLANGNAMIISTAGGVLWSNNLAVDGTISVVSTNVPRPVINSVTLSGASLITRGTHGLTNGNFYVLASTNLATPASWVPVSTNAFDASGNFNVTNAVSAGVPREFFRLVLP
jgi:autotransporter-associated beta strand protein